MRDDLISRKALIVDMKSRKYIDKALCEIFETVVNKAPTAFDKEKVIEELKSAIGDIHYTEDGSFNGKCIEDFEFIQAKTALELVEKGGIE